MVCGAGSLKGDSQGESLLLPVPHREHHDRGRLSMSSWRSLGDRVVGLTVLVPPSFLFCEHRFRKD